MTLARILERICNLLVLSLVAVGETQAQQAAQQPQPRLATLAQQKTCADQAKRAFNESDASKPSNDPKVRRVAPPEYTSHYDAKANVCYILVHEADIIETPDGTKTFSNSLIVYDAFEGRVFANFLWMSQKDKKAWEVSPVECSVKPRGQEEIACKSQSEFENLVDKHFGIGL